VPSSAVATVLQVKPLSLSEKEFLKVRENSPKCRKDTIINNKIDAIMVAVLMSYRACVYCVLSSAHIT
jgi:hypothetical protein